LSKKIRIDKTAVENKEKMANHDLESKIERRRLETEEIEKKNEEFMASLQQSKETINAEIENG